MKHVSFHRLSVLGFGVFRELSEVDLRAGGMVLIVGENADATAATSNGAGKTTIFKALSWGLFGRTVDGLTTDVRHVDAVEASVVVMFAVDGEPFEVLRERSKSGGKLRLTSDGIDVSATKVAETQDAIDRLLGVDFDGFRACVLFGQGDTARFASPGLSDAARKDLLAGLLGLARFDAARDTARAEASAAAARSAEEAVALRVVEGDLASLRREVAEAEAEAEGLRRALSGGSERLALRREEIAATRRELISLNGERVAAMKALDEAREEFDEVVSLRVRASDLLHEVTRQLRETDALLDRYADGGDCPTCAKALGETPEELFAAAEKLRRKKKAVADRLDEIEARRVALSERMDEPFAAVRALDERKARAEALKGALSREAEALEWDLSAGADGIAGLGVKAAMARARVGALETEAKAHTTEAKLFEGSRAAWEWWSRVGFGPKGVPALALEASLPALTEATNRHLSILSDGDLLVEWTATTTGAAGREKEVLTCTITVEGAEGVAASGGQRRKVELATELALSELVAEAGGSRFDLLCLDEALDGLDALAARRVVEWLRGLDKSSIFVVSHSDAVADAFDRVVVVHKSDGAATVIV